MRFIQVILLLSVSLAFTCCEVKVKTNNDKISAEANSPDKIRNSIQLQKKGLNVSQAYLQFEDGKLVPADNKIELQQTVKMKLLIDGWKEEEGKVFPGASEIIQTSKGDTILKSDDLFAEYTQGVSAEDTRIVSLSAVINNIDQLYDYFLVTYRVWDKKGDGEIKGSYKLFLK